MNAARSRKEPKLEPPPERLKIPRAGGPVAPAAPRVPPRPAVEEVDGRWESVSAVEVEIEHDALTFPRLDAETTSVDDLPPVEDLLRSQRVVVWREDREWKIARASSGFRGVAAVLVLLDPDVGDDL